MKYIVIILYAIFQSYLGYGQDEATYSCIDNDGWCGTYLKIYSDSSFIHTVGCEHMQSIQVGKIKGSFDTLVLEKYDLIFENFVDSIVFVSNDKQSDTIDIFYYDHFGKNASMDDNFITYKESSTEWINNPELNRVDFHSSEIVLFDRRLEYYAQTNQFLSKESYYHSVDDSYLISTNKDLVLILKDIYNWSGIKKIIQVPRKTRFIKIYYHLPSEIISTLNMYSVRLDHDSVKFGKCNDLIIKIE